MKFNEFYKTLEEVIGVEELKKFPPENEIPCKKIFMLMTLSVKPTSKENYQNRLEDGLKALDKKKKESTENVREKTETKDRWDEFIKSELKNNQKNDKRTKTSISRYDGENTVWFDSFSDRKREWKSSPSCSTSEGRFL